MVKKMMNENEGNTCILWFHDWGKWEEESSGSIYRYRGDGEQRKVGEYFIQQRVCNRCGRIQRKVEKEEII